MQGSLLLLTLTLGTFAPVATPGSVTECSLGLASQGKDIVTTAVEAGSFKTLVAAVKAAGLVETLQGKGPFTVFAPTDEAFAKLPKGVLDGLLKPENKAQLAVLLTYHVVAGKVPSSDAVKLDFVPTVQGSALALQVERDAHGKATLTIDGAKVVKADIACSNGVIHVIDTVVMPRANIVETAQAAGTFNTLLAAAKAAGLVEALSGEEPLTLFAPTDDAFAKLPKGAVESLLKPENKQQLADLLKFHVVAGRVLAKDVVKARELATLTGAHAKIAFSDTGATIAGALVTRTDILAGNGVIHVIDAVMMP